MSIDIARYAAKSDPTCNPNFSAFWANRSAFFRSDAVREQRLAEADRRRADGLAAERTAHLAARAREARP